MSNSSSVRKSARLRSTPKSGQSSGQRSKRFKRLNKIVFTQQFVDDLRGSGKRARFYDLKVGGLLLELMPSGSKIFRFMRVVKNKQQWNTIGASPNISLEKARNEAIRLSCQLVDGADFQLQRDQVRNELTLGELATLYIEQYATGRCQTYEQMQKDFSRWFKEDLGLRLSQVTTNWIQVRLNKLYAGKHPARANKARDHIRAIFQWGKKQKFCSDNPAQDTNGFKVQARERFLQPEEFEKILTAIHEYPDDRLRDLFLLCLYTGQRVGNIQAMRWEQINLQMKVWVIPRTKTGQAHTHHLTDASIEVLTERKKMPSIYGWVFPGGNRMNNKPTKNHITEPKKAWKVICAKAGLEDLNIHDLRRSLGAWSHMTGGSVPTVQRILGHKTLAAAAVYQRVTDNEARVVANRAVETMLHLANRKPSSTA